MRRIGLQDIELLDVGNTIDLYGAIYSGNGKVYLVPFPIEDPTDLDGDVEVLVMDPAEMAMFLNQSDVLDTPGPNKAILRKSQRQVDAVVAWNVFRRDNYQCRYCGRRAPLTVDHVVLWEEGGASVEDNLIAACKRCNKLRGRMQYEDWLNSETYCRMETGTANHLANIEVLKMLPRLREMKVKVRSR